MRIARDIDPNGPHAPDIVPLTGTEALVMRWVHHNPGASPSAVAAATALQRSNCSVALRSLVAKGMIERQTAPDDARVVRCGPPPWRTRAFRSFTPTGPTACASRSTATTPGSRRLPSCSRVSRADCAAVTRRSRRLPAEASGVRDPGVTPHYAPDRPTPRHPVASSHQPLRRQVKPCPARSRRQSTRSSAAWRPRTRLRGGTASSSSGRRLNRDRGAARRHHGAAADRRPAVDIAVGEPVAYHRSRSCSARRRSSRPHAPHSRAAADERQRPRV